MLVTFPGRLPPGDGASRAASIAGRRGRACAIGRYPDPGREPARSAPSRAGRGRWRGRAPRPVSGSSRAAWSRPATRLERVTCLRRPARPSCGQSQPVGSRSHPPVRCPGGWPVATAARILVRREARRGSSTPGPGRSSHRVCCAGGGIERNQSQARPGQAVSGQRRAGSRLRSLPARITVGPSPRPGSGSGRRLTAGAAAGRMRPGTVAGRSLPAETAAGQRLSRTAADRMQPGTMVRQKLTGAAAAVRMRPRTGAGRWVRPGEAEAPRRAGTMTSGRNRPPRWGPLTAPPLAPARPTR